MNDWDWFTSNALTTKEPVTKTVSDFATKSFLFQPARFWQSLLLYIKGRSKSLSWREAIFCVAASCYISTFQHFYDWRKAKLFSKFPVTFIVGRYGHDCTCSGQLARTWCSNQIGISFPVTGLTAPVKPCSFLGKMQAEVWFKTGLVILCSLFVQGLVIASTKSCSGNSRTKKVSGRVVKTVNSLVSYLSPWKWHWRTSWFSNPVALHGLDRLWPVKIIQVGGSCVGRFWYCWRSGLRTTGYTRSNVPSGRTNWVAMAVPILQQFAALQLHRPSLS